MFEIKIKIGDIEFSYSEPIITTGAYIRLLSSDKYVDGKTKSERIIEVIKEMVDQIIKLNNENKSKE